MAPIVLSIAGFDPSSGAGITADIKTAAAHGCFGVSCITALTVQSTQGVWQVQPVAGLLVKNTLERLANDMELAAVRIGMLGSAEVANAVADFLEVRDPKAVILDPVVRSTSGTALVDAQGFQVLMKRLLPLATLVTPNTVEASEITSAPINDLAGMAMAAKAIHSMGAKNVLVTGGHLPENTDLLLLESGGIHHVLGARVSSKATHGTGCAMATAIACNLANGMELLEAVLAAKIYVREAIEAAYPIGQGQGPMNHLYRLKKN